ncbi:MAG: 16S rRNA (adenine(1518)-N(6)/adenine(1519)-N(6))-dimethyltransferase RsmA [bacterium]
MYIAPKKSLGQHWLNSPKALREMVESAQVSPGDIIVEIGPGKGVLTEALLATGAHVVAIEKDNSLIGLLEEKFEKELQNKTLSIISGDILRFDPETLKTYGKKYKLVANIPYYITGAIIEQFLSAHFQPEIMVLLMQKEVAERIVSRDTDKESILSIAVSVYGKPKIISKVPKGAFVPPPKVDSAILCISSISRDFFADVDEKTFFSIVKKAFGTKRKQISTSLSEMFGSKKAVEDVLVSIGVDIKARPETLSLIQWKGIVKSI